VETQLMQLEDKKRCQRGEYSWREVHRPFLEDESSL
jgi:hypothetical protein